MSLSLKFRYMVHETLQTNAEVMLRTSFTVYTFSIATTAYIIVSSPPLTAPLVTTPFFLHFLLLLRIPYIRFPLLSSNYLSSPISSFNILSYPGHKTSSHTLHTPPQIRPASRPSPASTRLSWRSCLHSPPTQRRSPGSVAGC